MTASAGSWTNGISLRPWQVSDVGLLHRMNTAAMTRHVGGPETDDAVEARQLRYVRMWETGGARMFAITASGDETVESAVGGIGWWPSTWRGQAVYEAGWGVVPEAQGRGVAHAAVALLIEDARSHAERHLLTAFPSVANVASNRLCLRAGFHNHGIESFPFRGTTLIVNAWALELNPFAGH